MSVSKLVGKIIAVKNPTAVGLDPDLSYIPDFIKKEQFEKWGPTLEGARESILAFNRAIIDAVYDIVPAIKPQSAYYELYGWQGVEALSRTIEYAKSRGMYVIADVKRNDIGSTADAYARAYLGDADIGGERISPFGADAATVNGYLGTDGIEPFLKRCREGKMIFVLVRTSNPSAGELQDLALPTGTVFEAMADRVNQWGETAMTDCGYSEVGAVVGATWPKELLALRRRMEKIFFLVPGYGAQGGSAADIAGAFDKEGLGAIVNSSRAIMCAYKKDGVDEADFAAAARAEAVRMRDEILNALK